MTVTSALFDTGMVALVVILMVEAIEALIKRQWAGFVVMLAVAFALVAALVLNLATEVFP